VANMLETCLFIDFGLNIISLSFLSTVGLFGRVSSSKEKLRTERLSEWEFRSSGESFAYFRASGLNCNGFYGMIPLNYELNYI